MKNEKDIIIVGYGAAGAAAALTAANLDASVVILEKQPEDAHYSSTRMSGGLVMGADDADAAARYLDECSGGMIPAEVSRAWAEKAIAVKDWMRSVGIESVHMAGGWYPKLDGFESIKVFGPLPKGTNPDEVEIELPRPGELTFKFPLPFGNGQLLHDLLVEAVDASDSIEVIYDCPVSELMTIDGVVRGVKAAGEYKGTTFAAKKGVILACGGFEQNQEMILNYLKAYPIYFYGSEANTGDGIRMAQAVGADLWHMNQMIGRAVGHFAHPDGRELTFNISLNPPGYAIVDKHGKRFANEHLQAVSKANFYYELLHYDADLLDYPRIPAYWIFDKRRVEARALSGGSFGNYAWSKDNRAEIDMGWIAEADTIEAAAAAAGVLDPAAAARAIEDYNQACKFGSDRFGRPADSLIPIDEPPFYCMPVYPGGATTNGGPRRDARARILDPFGKPIPGLFGAGELGGAIGMLYPSPGANLGEAFAFGALAAECALEI
ncbi:FAD-binding protein [Croceicoccus ponticola]|uniref:FAD-binding protein n=1 Tax=Croceicoccus ponticola TaxID=2217664 RepID=A0A437H218_9SPHN|nr:FAD-dependent oxidoreductase [Croceicoccus ponticola]RVQ69678.1 FAD-binding protein [Croceicoccus ponticola]